MKPRFLFVTANRKETNALLKDKDFFHFEEKRSPKTTDTTFYNVGKFGNYDIVHFELINQGSVKADASILAIYDAIDVWHPDAIILAGIAFGKDNENTPEPCQHIGDILVSKMVADYESGKIENGILKSDGFVSESGRHLISVFQHYSSGWNYFVQGRKAKVIMGLILSGDRVVDDEEFKSKLFTAFPRGIGGEMEGRGAYSACRRKGIDEWIIVKGICDWGIHKAENKTENQIVAAEATISFLKYIFSKPEAFEKLPEQQKPEIESINNTNINSVKEYAPVKDTKEIEDGSFYVSKNKAGTMIVGKNLTIHGGINLNGKQ